MGKSGTIIDIKAFNPKLVIGLDIVHMDTVFWEDYIGTVQLGVRRQS